MLRFREIEVSRKHQTLNRGSDTKTRYPCLEGLQRAAWLQELSMSMLLAWVKQEDIDLVLCTRGKDEQSPAIWYFLRAQTMHTNRRHRPAWAWQLLHFCSHFAALEPHSAIDSDGTFWMGYRAYCLNCALSLNICLCLSFLYVSRQVSTSKLKPSEGLWMITWRVLAPKHASNHKRQSLRTLCLT